MRRKIVQVLCLVAAFSLGGANVFFFSKAFCSASDELSQMEQEVISAKRMRQTILDRVQSVELALQSKFSKRASQPAPQPSVTQKTAEAPPTKIQENSLQFPEIVKKPVNLMVNPISTLVKYWNKRKSQGDINRALHYLKEHNYVKSLDVLKEAQRKDPQNTDIANTIKLVENEMSEQESAPPSAYTEGAAPPKAPSSLSLMPEDPEVRYEVAMADKKITVKEAVDIGLANYLPLQVAQKKVEVAKAKLREAKRALFPNLSGIWEEKRGAVARTSHYRGRTMKVQGTWPVFYGGELQNTIKQASANLESVKKEYDIIRSEQVLTIKKSYYAVVKAIYNAQYQSELFGEIQQIYQRVQSEYKEKLIPEVDYLNMESLYQQTYFQLESAKNDLASADMLLHQAINIDPDEPVPVDVKLNFMKLSVYLDDLIDLSLTNNPVIHKQELILESAYYGREVFKSKKLPHVDLQGSLGRQGEAARGLAIDTEREWFIGVKSSMPVGPNTINHTYTRRQFGPTVLALTGSQDLANRTQFDFLNNFAEMTDEKQAEADYFQAQEDFANKKNEVTAQVRDGYYEFQKSLIQVDASVARIRFQEKQLGVKRALVGLRETPVTELVGTLVELAQERFSFIRAVADYHISIANLNKVIGIEDYLTF